MAPLFSMTSDWHNDYGAWARRPEIRGDAFFALKQFRQYSLDHGTDQLAAGDLFDKDKPSSSVLERTFDYLHDMKRIGRKVVFTQGQHEKAYPPWLGLGGFNNVEHLHRKKISLRGMWIYGLDHVPADQLEAEISQIPPGVDLVMCHQVWGNFMGIGGVEGRIEMFSKPGGPHAILTGDYHDHKVIEVDGMQVYSPGSTCLQEISERRDKYFFVMNDDFTVTSVPLKTRTVYNVTVHTENELDYLIGQDIERLVEPQTGVPEEISKNIIYVQCGNVEHAFSRVSRKINGRAHLFWKNLVGQQEDIVYNQDEAEQRVPLGLTACLPLVAAEGTAVHNSALRLLNAKDKKVELEAMAREWGRPQT